MLIDAKVFCHFYLTFNNNIVNCHLSFIVLNEVIESDASLKSYKRSGKMVY